MGTKFSQISAATVITSTDTILGVQGGNTIDVRYSVAPLGAYIVANNLATSSVAGAVIPDGTIITVSTGSITVPKASHTVFGVVETDNTTITASSGVITGASTTIAGKSVPPGGSYAPTRTSSVPSGPTGTTSTTHVMAGLAIAVTPATSGTLLIQVSGNMTTSTAGDGGAVQIAYGTGSAPSNGASATGTTAGSNIQLSNAAGLTNSYFPFSLTAIVTGLTTGVAYWIDLQQAAVTGGTLNLANLSIAIVEL